MHNTVCICIHKSQVFKSFQFNVKRNRNCSFCNDAQNVKLAENTLVIRKKCQHLQEHWDIREHCALPSVPSLYTSFTLICRLLQASKACHWIILIVVQLPASVDRNTALRDLTLKKLPRDENVPWQSSTAEGCTVALMFKALKQSLLFKFVPSHLYRS